MIENVLGFVEEIVAFIEKGCRNATFFRSLYRLLGERWPPFWGVGRAADGLLGQC